MNTQSPNNNMDPSPLELETQEPDEVDRGSEKVRRRKMWPLLLIIFSFLGLLAGLLAGGIYFSQCPKVYKSEATITICPRQKMVWGLGGDDQNENPFSIRHDQFIGQDNILTKCLIEYCLQDLKTLRDFPPTEQIKEIRDHLVVRQNPDEPTQYLLEFSSSNPRDSQTVLATIVATYEKHLDEKYRGPDSGAGRMNLLIKMSDRFK